MHQSVRNRVVGKKKMANLFADIGDVAIVAEGVVEIAVPVVSVVSKSNTKRIGNCGRKRKDDGELPSNKLKKAAHGADSFLEYQEACSTEATASSILIRDENISYSGAAKLMQARLIEKGAADHGAAATADVDDAPVANAHANADADDACSDVDASA